MLNKKDPLLDVVTGVISESDATRMAIEAANKHFGVTSRKALPHELHEAYDKMVVEGKKKDKVYDHDGNEVDISGWHPTKLNAYRALSTPGSQAPEQTTETKKKTKDGYTLHEDSETLEESEKRTEKRTPRLSVRSKYHKIVYGERLKKAAFGHSGLEFYKSDEGDLIKATYSNALPPGADDPKGSGVGRSRTRWYEGKGKGPNTTIKPIKNPTLKEETLEEGERLDALKAALISGAKTAKETARLGISSGVGVSGMLYATGVDPVTSIASGAFTAAGAPIMDALGTYRDERKKDKKYANMLKRNAARRKISDASLKESNSVFNEIRNNILNEMATITDEEKLMSYIDNLSEEQMDILGLAEASASDKKKPDAEDENGGKGLVDMPAVPNPKVPVQARQLGAQGAAAPVSARPATGLVNRTQTKATRPTGK